MKTQLLLSIAAMLAGATVARGASTGTGDPIYAFGLPHEALGQAMLVQKPSGDLLVTNIGSSGEDGVQVELGEADGLLLRVQEGFDPELTPDGAYHSTTITARDAGGMIVSQLTILTEDIGDQLLVSSDFGTASRTLQVLLEGVVVAEVPRHAGPSDFMIDRIPVAGLCWLKKRNGMWEWKYPFGITQLIDPFGGPSVAGDEIRASPDQEPAIGVLGDFAIRAADLPQMTIIDEALLAFMGIPFRALGQSHMSMSDRLVVDNIGSSGNDGVSIEITGGRHVLVGMTLTPAVAAESIATIATSGSVSGAEDVPLAATLLQEIASVVQLVPDFQPIGGTMYSTEVYNAGQLVVTLTNQIGAAAEFPSWPDSFAVTGLTVEVGWINELPIDLPDGSNVVGDQIVISSEDHAVNPEALTDVSLTASSVESIDLQSVEIRSCSADLTSDNLVGIGDLLVLLAAWGPNPGHPADLDGDNIVGIGDLLALLAAWGSCP